MAHTPLRIAHRGMPRLARENTLAAFALALDAGCDGIELDVHVTVDGQVVVHHDPALPDGTPIAEASLRTLRDRARAADLALPTLTDTLALVLARDADVELFVELKGAASEGAVATVLSAHPAVRAAVHSFDHAMIARMAALDTGLRLGILLEGGVADLHALLERTGASDVWPHHSITDESLVRDAHAAGARVIPWTVNDAARAASLAELLVDGICSDDVRMLAAA